MHKVFLVLLATAIFGSANVAAEDDSGTGFYGELGYNWFRVDDKRVFDDSDDVYLGLGYQFDKHWAADFKYSEADYDWKFPSTLSDDLTYYSLSAVYRLQPRTESSFFWKAGLGRLEFGDNSEGGANFIFGAGYEQQLSNKFSLVLGMDAAYINRSDSFLDYIPYVGVNYFFGTPAHPKPPIATAAKDSDNDGVSDANDRCPNTAAGRTVDSRGCELDSDNDGVVDYADQCPRTPAGAKVDSKGCRIVLTEDVSIALNVTFANDSNAISADFHNEINKVAEFMRRYPDTNVVIEGHTDSRGAASYNQKLSQKRANAVMAYLTDKLSISSSRVSAIGKGESSPIADNATAEGRAINRRVQAEIKTSVSKPQ